MEEHNSNALQEHHSRAKFTTEDCLNLEQGRGVSGPEPGSLWIQEGKSDDPLRFLHIAQEGKNSVCLTISKKRGRLMHINMDGYITSDCKPINHDLLAAHEQIIALASGWDENGAIGPKEPLSWESVARIAMDIAQAAKARAEGRYEQHIAAIAKTEGK